jgi:hypothetical protein
MVVVKNIQASGGDYTTINAWIADRGGGTLSDIEEGRLADENFASGDFDGLTTTSATAFWRLTTQNAGWQGDFAGTFPKITSTSNNWLLRIKDDFTEVFGIVCGPILTQDVYADFHGVLIDGATDVKLENMAVWDIDNAYEDVGTINLYGIKTNADRTFVICCCVAHIYVENTDVSSGNANCYGIYASATGLNDVFSLFNSATFNCGSTADAGTATAYGIYVTEYDYAWIVNNVAAYFDTSYDACIYTSSINTLDKDYNATTDSTAGTNGQNLITITDEWTDINKSTLDVHLKVGADCLDNGLNLY